MVFDRNMDNKNWVLKGGCGSGRIFRLLCEEYENKIADLKANFDYVLEGKEVEYREERKKLCDEFENMKAGLESQVAELKDHLAEEVELHLHAEEYIESLEKEIKELKHNKKTVVHLADCLEEKMKERIEELEKENAELRNNGFTVSAMTEQQLKVAIEKGERLEKENAEWEKFVKDIQNRNEENYLKVCHKLATELNRGIELADQLTKAKEIIKNCVCIIYRLSPTTALLDKNERSLLKQAEQFIK